jgi:eukaryotic-like serine/threonine-protein kinase
MGIMANREQSAEQLFGAVLDLALEDRAAFLDESCRGAPELRRHVEELLHDNDRLGSFLEQPLFTPDGVSTAWGLTTSASPTGAPRFQPTQLIADRFLVVRFIARGGMGEVYEVKDQFLQDANVALKIIRPEIAADVGNSRRFEQEVILARKVAHPNLCPIYEIFHCAHPGPPFLFLTMKLLSGETLDTHLKLSKNLPAVEVCKQLLTGVAALHAAGIIHRDIKPGNVMLEQTAQGLHVSIMDFGLARLYESELAVRDTAVIAGTRGYMAPELFRGQAPTKATDIFALGIVLQQILTGEHPLETHLSVTPVSSLRAASVPTYLLQGVEGFLSADPELRLQAFERVRSIQEGTTPDRKDRRYTWITLSLALFLIAALAAWRLLTHHRTVLTERDTIVLADFDNKTGDPVFDDTLRQGLSVELQQSPFLSLVTDRKVQQTLALMGQPKETRLTSEMAQQVCERTASAMVLEGSIASLGSQYVLGLRARNCNTGTIVDQEQVQAARREDVLNSLSQIARKFRRHVGESLATVEKHSTPLAEATTPSLEALKAYSTGLKVNLFSGTGASIPFFQRAVEIDPKFAMAYAVLGLDYSAEGESVLSVKSTTRAWQLRDRVSDRERFFIDFTYDRQVTGNLEKAYQTLELWLQTYPRGEQPNAQSLLGGLATHGTGRFERAIEASRQTIAADPGVVYGYGNLASSYFFLDRFDEAENVLQRASERNLDEPPSLVLRYNIAALKGEKDQMDRLVALAKDKHGAEHRLANSEALALVRSGRLQAARRSSNRAVDLALQGGEREAAANYQAARAVWEAVYGNAAEAKRNAMAALAVSKGRDVEYAAALGLALSGESSQSQTLTEDLEKRFPEDTFVKFTYVPVLRALAALERGKPADSIESLQVALPYELAVNGLSFNFYLGGLHSAYVRGNALVAAHRYTEAAAEFQKILNHRGIVGSDPIGALAHLQLGRVYTLAGDKAKATTAYQDFLTLWKDADPGTPLLKQAQAECAKLEY